MNGTISLKKVYVAIKVGHSQGYAYQLLFYSLILIQTKVVCRISTD